MAIVEIDFIGGLNLLYKPNSVDHKALLLASSDGGRRASIMPFTSWFISPADPQGWRFSVYIFTKHYSHVLVGQIGQFTVNVPRDGMDNIVEYCGSVSGRDHDKFSELSLSKITSKYVIPPIIGECAAHLECETQRTYPFTMTFPGQDKKDIEMTVFETQILAIYAQEDIARQIRDSAH